MSPAARCCRAFLYTLMKKIYLFIVFLTALSVSGQTSEPKVAKDDQVYTPAGLDVAPTFPGGTAKFIDFVNKEYAKDKVTPNPIKGKVYAQFIVNTDGSLSDIIILRQPEKGIGKELSRIIAASPKWTPGQLKGKKVKVKYTIPIEINTEKYQSGSVSDRVIGGYDNVVTPYEDDDYLKKKKENKIHVMPDLDEGPKFPGGNDNFTKEFDKRFDKKILTGNVWVGVDFVLEKDGTLTFKIMTPRVEAVDTEIARVLNSMPKWTPGKINGQPVRCAFSQRFYIRKS